ncbi:uncharacterized protein [Littorina saxatilis]|uniref:Chitin-binding type-2 domain-containing protein n=1 Tax=Littorina saxatilis TaxID=31220 RepID=A0AAN9AJR4_9CAEN
MAVEKIVAALLVFVVALGSVTSQSNNCASQYPPCASVPGSVEYFYPNWNDCNTYWRCQNQQATQLACPPGQVFDFYTFTCKPRPTRETLASNPVFSCEILLNGVAALTSQG